MSSEWLIGRHGILAALQGRTRDLHELVVRPGARSDTELLEAARGAGLPVREARRDELDRFGSPAAALRCGSFRYRAESAIPAAGAGTDLVVVLDRIQDPQNLGAMVRSAEAAGARALIVAERHAAAVTPAVVRASAGATERLPIHRVVNIARALQKLKAAGFWTVGLEPEAATPWHAVDYRVPVALVVGAEGAGLRPLVARHCDFLVTLTMRGETESLNASAALAAVLYEVVRQQTAAD